MPSIHQHVAAARQQLRQAGIPDAEAELDARLMAQWLLGWDAARLLASAHDEAPPTFPARYGALAARRAGREPMAYLLGRQEFWGLMFDVTPAVLIPRPETELIVEIALELFPDRDVPLQIADIGTGSGCLATALASERPRARITASDVSAAALLVASNNAVRHGVDGCITFIEGELFSPMPARLAFDLIVSNPPYVPTDDLAVLQPEVREHEPAVALFGGTDGLSVIRPLVEQAVERLTPNGALIFEFGVGQADAIRGLISSTDGLRMIDLRRDLQGIPRTAIARRIQDDEPPRTQGTQR
jgi:release factor glutamine methyltransferase